MRYVTYGRGERSSNILFFLSGCSFTGKCDTCRIWEEGEGGRKKERYRGRDRKNRGARKYREQLVIKSNATLWPPAIAHRSHGDFLVPRDYRWPNSPPFPSLATLRHPLYPYHSISQKLPITTGVLIDVTVINSRARLSGAEAAGVSAVSVMQ